MTEPSFATHLPYVTHFHDFAIFYMEWIDRKTGEVALVMEHPVDIMDRNKSVREFADRFGMLWDDFIALGRQARRDPDRETILARAAEWRKTNL